MHPLCRLHGALLTLLMCSILYAQAPSSQTFFLLLFVFFSLMRSPLMVLVSYILQLILLSRISYPYSVGYYHTKEHLCCPHLSKCWYAPPFSLYATRRVYAGQMCVVLLTPFAYLVQCLKRVSFFRLSFLFFLHIFPLPTYKRCRRCSNSSILLLDGLFSR